MVDGVQGAQGDGQGRFVRAPTLRRQVIAGVALVAFIFGGYEVVGTHRTDDGRHEVGVSGDKPERMREVRRRLIEGWKPLLNGLPNAPKESHFQVEQVTGSDPWGEIVLDFGALSQADDDRLARSLQEQARAQGWHDAPPTHVPAQLKGTLRLWGPIGSGTTMFVLSSGEVAEGLDQYSPLIGPVPELLPPLFIPAPPSAGPGTPSGPPPSASALARRPGSSGLNMT